MLKGESKEQQTGLMMQARVDESRRQVADDIDLFRMQPSYEDGESKQGTTLAAQSKESCQYAINYEYRSRDEVANAILKLQGKGKQAEYVSRAQAQRAKLQQNPRRDVKIRKEARETAVIEGAVTQSHSSRTGSVWSVARSFVSRSDVSKEAREPAVIAEDVTQSNSARTGPLLDQEYSTKPSQNNMSVARSFVSMSLASRAATDVETGEQVVSNNVQRHSLHIEPKTKPAYISARSKKTKKTDGLLKSLFRCGMCATETQMPDFSVVEEVKEYSVEGLANHVQELKIETSSQFLSPPPPSAYIHVAPCDVVHHSESIGGCSTITHSVAGKLVVRDEAEEIHSVAGKLVVSSEAEEIRDNVATTKHSNLSACASSLMDRDNEASDHMDEQVVSKIPSVQAPSHEHMSDAEYESLGLGSKETSTQHYSASKSDSLSFMSVDEKGSSMGLSSASELGTRTQSQSFSLSLRDQDSNTFSSASEGASEEDSDYTLTDGSSSSSAPSSIDDSFVLSSYASTMQEDDSMTYGTSVSGSSSSSSSSSSDSYYESRYD